MLREPVEIPPEAETPKPLFTTLPGAEVVTEIREWIKGGNPVFMWRGHTHNKPNKGEPVEYLNDFAPLKGKPAPCPICSHSHTKFQRIGIIAWFPESGLIRLIGPDCFRSFNPEGHDRAWEALQRRKEDERYRGYLLKSITGVSPKARDAIVHAMPLAEHLDNLAEILGKRLANLEGIYLWDLTREGLKRIQETTEGPVSTTYANVAGSRLVDPNRKQFTSRLRQAIQVFDRLRGFSIELSTHEERTAVARAFSRSLRIANECWAEMQECRRFLSLEATATMRNWGALPDSEERLYVRRTDDLILLIGRTEHEAKRIKLLPCINQVLKELPASWKIG